MRTLFSLLLAPVLGAAPIERTWLTHQTGEPTAIVVNWQTDDETPSVVEFGPTPALGRKVERPADRLRIHHVEIPLTPGEAACYYRVRSGDHASEIRSFQCYPSDGLRVAVVADTGYAKAPWADAVAKEKPHLLISAGDHVPALHSGKKVAAGDTTAFSALVARHPALFGSTPWMPLLGNHDREIRPRGPKPPEEPVYDVEATAFREFFALPDEEWKWRFDLPAFGVRFVALDLSHTQDHGTTWQTNHAFLPGSPQFEWFRATMETSPQPFLITLYNERNATVRGFAGGAYARLLARGSLAITGFGYYAERAESDGLTYYNTSVGGKGTPYRDPRSRFLRSEDNYLLLTFARGRLTVAVKSLAGETMDEQSFDPRPAGR